MNRSFDIEQSRALLLPLLLVGHEMFCSRSVHAYISGSPLFVNTETGVLGKLIGDVAGYLPGDLLMVDLNHTVWITVTRPGKW